MAIECSVGKDRLVLLKPETFGCIDIEDAEYVEGYFYGTLTSGTSVSRDATLLVNAKLKGTLEGSLVAVAPKHWAVPRVGTVIGLEYAGNWTEVIVRLRNK